MNVVEVCMVEVFCRCHPGIFPPQACSCLGAAAVLNSLSLTVDRACQKPLYKWSLRPSLLHLLACPPAAVGRVSSLVHLPLLQQDLPCWGQNKV